MPLSHIFTIANLLKRRAYDDIIETSSERNRFLRCANEPVCSTDRFNMGVCVSHRMSGLSKEFLNGKRAENVNKTPTCSRAGMNMRGNGIMGIQHKMIKPYFYK